jgi:NADH-quinone oxidoreductase subunit G
MEGLWQSQQGAAQPVGESRPGWKVLRVLGNLLNLPGFEYQTSEDVREELRKVCNETGATSPLADVPVAASAYKGSHQVGGSSASAGTAGEALLDLPMYQIDALVRRAPSLQKTREGRTPAATY